MIGITGEIRTSFVELPVGRDDQRQEEPEEIAQQLFLLAKGAIAELDLPYEHQSNPFAEEAQQITIAWIRKFHILDDEDAIQKINSSAFAPFIGKAHPRALLPQLAVVALFATWLFIYDDVVERLSSREEIAASNTRVLEILNNCPVEDQDTPLIKGLHDIVLKMGSLCDFAPWKERLVADVKAYCEGTLWEFDNRHKEEKPQVPHLEDYLKMRPDTSGTRIMFDFIELVEGIELPESFAESAYFHRMRSIGANLVNWENDLLSAKKELEKDVHNLVFVYKEHQGISYEEAVNLSKEQLKTELEKLEALEREFLGIQQDVPAAAAYFRGIKEWVAGHHFWAKESPRYSAYFNVNTL